MRKTTLAWIFLGLIYGSSAMGMTLTSTAFSEGGKIPDIYSCDGKDMAPDLTWSAVPIGTKSFALIMDDPDAPSGLWTHWVLFNIPANVTKLASNAALPEGALIGNNSWGRAQYNGPCPPYNKTHRYNFKLYALNTVLKLPSGASAAQVMGASEHHIMGQVKLMGKYERSH
ncbi:MAG TPA: YbhB/YbcL family Raf kinase inhibitor-like protein [Gammaproteobacteria bacterium]|nr:YbhB/YbcL family Raf kinase inhibitor-like protein [Gammaproteobacteria bacterium]